MSSSRSRPTLCLTSGWLTSITGIGSVLGSRACRAAPRRWRSRLVQADAARHRHVQALDRAAHRQAHQLVAGACAVSWRMPLPSAPSTSASGPLQVELVERAAARRRWCRRRGCRAPSARSSVRARLVTMKYGTVSAAPLATLATVALMPTAWSFGAITACAPAPSATRRQAPRLCGSVTPSSTSSSGGPSTRRACRRANGCCASASTRATTPWWRVRAAELAQALVVAVDQLAPASCGALDELAHALVAPAGVDVHLDDRVRRRLQAHADGVEAEQDLCCSCGDGSRWAPSPVTRGAQPQHQAPISTGWCSM